MESDTVLQSILQMLQSADDPGARLFPPTELYSEGWMLRLLLWYGARGADCLPVQMGEASRWYSEARLDSPFLKRAGSESNHLAEGQTHADGVLGHFEFRGKTEAGLVVSADARQLVVFEAKMMSQTPFRRLISRSMSELLVSKHRRSRGRPRYAAKMHVRRRRRSHQRLRRSRSRRECRALLP